MIDDTGVLRLILVAHAPTGATRRATFPLDEPIEEAAREASAALAGSFGRVDAAWSSPALRARETASLLGLDATVEPSLRDLDLGQWAGLAPDAVATAEPQAMQAWMTDSAASPHGGESIDHLVERVRAWLGGVGAGHGRVVAVTHAAVIRAATVAVLGAPPTAFWRIDAAPLSRSEFHATGGRWSVSALNRTP